MVHVDGDGMKHALIGFALGLVLCGSIVCGWWIFDGFPKQNRVLEDLERTRSDLDGAQRELEVSRRKLAESTKRLDGALFEIGIYRKDLDRSKAELERYRNLLSVSSGQVDSSLTGVERLREIIQGLPAIGNP